MQKVLYNIKKVVLPNKCEIAYLDEGKSTEVILCIHGLGSYMWSWIKNVEILRGGYRIIALDLPGYGQSSSGDFPYTMDFYADTVKLFIEKLGLTEVNLAGHSMGGQIAAHIAIAHYKRIKRLILVAPAGIETFNTFQKQIIKATYNPFLAKTRGEEQYLLNYQLSFHQLPEEARFMVKDRQNLMKDAKNYDYYLDMISKSVNSMLDTPTYPYLQNIKIPTLIVFGANDLLIPNRLFHPTDTPLSIMRRGQRKIHGSEAFLIPLCGHFVQFERAARFNELLIEFIKRQVNSDDSRPKT